MLNTLPDGLVVFCKQDCPTCTLVEPLLATLSQSDIALTVYTQDDPTFPTGVANIVDETDLEQSYHLDIETVPTLIRVAGGQEVERTVGWHRAEWQRITGIDDLGAELPEQRPGCGALNVMPGIAERLAVRFGDAQTSARQVVINAEEDVMEACYARGWTDGLPIVPPTEERVLRMLQGTDRASDEIVAAMPPNYSDCTVEKIAINAVMAGCKPEYMPVVLAAVEAVCVDKFCMQGVLATTYFSSPMIIVNGPIVKAIGMNSGGNLMGQGNRANATIGRALQLIIRNVGGGRPGGVDRSTFGTPGKYTSCIAEDEAGSPWESLAVERGFEEGTSTVTMFSGSGVQGMMDQLSRTPESLARSLAASLRTVCHPKLVMSSDALVIISPEHGNIFRAAGWSKARLRDELNSLLMISGEEVVRGAGGIAEGIPASRVQDQMPKFRPGGLQIIHAGGTAGLFSAIISGWPSSGDRGTQPVTVAIR